MGFQSTDINVHTIAQPRFQGWQRPHHLHPLVGSDTFQK